MSTPPEQMSTPPEPRAGRRPGSWPGHATNHGGRPRRRLSWTWMHGRQKSTDPHRQRRVHTQGPFPDEQSAIVVLGQIPIAPQPFRPVGAGPGRRMDPLPMTPTTRSATARGSSS
jgi:hypothetical protein